MAGQFRAFWLTGDAWADFRLDVMAPGKAELSQKAVWWGSRPDSRGKQTKCPAYLRLQMRTQAPSRCTP